MKTFCESFRKQAMEIINFKKKNMKLLTKEAQESYENSNIRYICNQNVKENIWKTKKPRTVRDYYRRIQDSNTGGVAHNTCNFK